MCKFTENNNETIGSAWSKWITLMMISKWQRQIAIEAVGYWSTLIITTQSFGNGFLVNNVTRQINVYTNAQAPAPVNRLMKKYYHRPDGFDLVFINLNLITQHNNETKHTQLQGNHYSTQHQYNCSCWASITTLENYPVRHQRGRRRGEFSPQDP